MNIEKRSISPEQHPELKDGEIFLANGTKNEGLPPYRTARMGNIAYDNKGNPIEGLFPIFVQKDELDGV